MNLKLHFLATISLLQISLFAQNNRTIKFVDKATKEPLIGVTILCQDFGTTTDLDGMAELPADKCATVNVSLIGYKSISFRVADASNEVALESSSIEIDAVTVTGSRYERRLSENTVSVDVIKPSLIKSINTSKADEVINKLPGVQVVGGQANIRGGSGFSYGAGSRVMIMIDDMPALQTDAGFANWGDMPVEHMEQVEVLKGAASSLYGSAALNGIINFRRIKPTTTPKFSAFTATTIYGDPKDLRSKWWTSTRYRTNLGLSYAKKVNKLDVGAHGFFSKLESYNESTQEQKYRGGLNLTYHKSDRLQYGVNTMINYIDGSDFFLWGNAIRNVLRPTAGTVSEGKRTRIMIDPFIKYRTENGANHRLMGRLFITNNNQNMNQSNSSNTGMIDYQYQKSIPSLGLVTTLGGFYNITDSQAQLFNDSTYLYQNAAIYGQLEKQFSGKLIASLGLRYEYNDQKSPKEFLGITVPNGRVTDGQVVARAGINYKLADFTNLRASWGQGYRYPTVTERFIRTSFGGFQIFPNPLLTPEYGFSTEVAVKQGIKVGGIMGFLDVSGFWQQYTDMIEFSFIASGTNFGFKPINVGNTRITGTEVSFMGKFKVGPVDFTTLTGYTYIVPVYLNFDENPQIRSSVSSGVNELKYRSRHSAKSDIEGSFEGLTIGFAWQRYSHMVNIDKQIEEPLIGQDLFEIKAFRKLNPNGFNTFDFRLGYALGQFKLSAILANATNQLYTIRPGLAEAPKNYTLRLDYDF